MNGSRRNDDLDSYVSWIDDGSSVAPSRSGAFRQRGEKDYYQLGVLARHKQEQNLDAYKQQIFDLQLSVYHYKEKLKSISTEHVDKLTKENKKLKEDNLLLHNELKRYKTLVIELDNAVIRLQRKLGMKNGDQEESDPNANYYKEQYELLLEENAQLKKELQSAENTSTQDTEDSELYKQLKKKYKQAKQQIEDLEELNEKQNREIDNYKRQEKQKQKDDLRRSSSILSARNKTADETSERITELEREAKRLGDVLSQTKRNLTEKTKECDGHIRQLEELRIENAELAQELEGFDQLQKEHEEQSIALAQREDDIITLEKEIEKLVDYIDKTKEHDEASGDEVATLIQALQQKEEEVKSLEDKIIQMDDAHLEDLDNYEGQLVELREELQRKDQQFKQLNDAHHEDLDNYEEQLAGLREELQQKDQEFKDFNDAHHKELDNYKQQLAGLEEELQETEQRYKELQLHLENTTLTLQNQRKHYEEALEGQYNELVIAVKEKEVSIASLESEIEVQRDIADKEKQLLKEKLEGSHEKLADQAELLAENNKKWQKRVAKLESDLTKYKQRLEEQSDNCNRLKHELYAVNQKNGLLNDMLDKSKRSSELSNGNKSSTLLKLNDELRKELQDKDNILASQKTKYEAIKQKHMDLKRQLEVMQKQLSKRDAMLANSLIATDNMKRHHGIMEGILYEQATGSQAVKIRAKSAMSS